MVGCLVLAVPCHGCHPVIFRLSDALGLGWQLLTRSAVVLTFSVVTCNFVSYTKLVEYVVDSLLGLEQHLPLCI